MKSLIAILSLLTICGRAEAQTFKVKKIQGTKMVVEVPDSSQFSVNQTYNVANAHDYSQPPSGNKGGNRDHAVSMSFSYLNQGSPSYSYLNISTSYLWNLKTYEAGPIVGLQNYTGNALNSNTTEFGALGYYNFNENKPGTETVLSALGQITVSSGSGSSATNILAGPNYRWFLLSSDHCFSFSALYKITQQSGGSTSGLLLHAGIATYF